MSIPQSDILILNVLKEGISELRKYPFYLDFLFEYANLPLVEKAYGQKEIERAKTWFLQNYIEIGFEWSFDQARYPSILITHPSSAESKPLAALGDYDMPDEEYIEERNIITEPRYIVGPINVSYDLTTGIVTLPNTFIEYPLIFKGQSLVSKKSNTSYPITEILSESQFRIEANLHDDFTETYVRPHFNKLKVIRRIAHFNENFNIECRVNGETAAISWLHTIALYVLLKNRMLLEQNSFGITTITSSGVSQEIDDAHGGNIIYLKSINLEALVQSRWVQEFSQSFEGITSGINLVQVNDPTKTIYATIIKT